MPITQDDLLDWSALLGSTGNAMSSGGESYMGDDAAEAEWKRQQMANALSMSEPAQPVEVAQPVAESSSYMDLKDVPDEVQSNQGLSAEDFNVKTGDDATAQKQVGMEPWRRNLLSLGAMFSRAGSAMMNDRENGKQVGNTMANYFEGQLYGDARKKALAAALSGSNGGSRPFGNSPMEAMLDLDTRGLNVDQIKNIYDTAYAEHSKERQFPIALATSLSKMGLTEAQTAEAIQQLGLRPREMAMREKAVEQNAELQEATMAEKRRATEQKKRTDERWLDTKAKVGAGTIALPDAIKPYWSLIEGLDPEEATKIVTKAISMDKERPITTPDAMLISEAQQNKGKVSPETMKLYEIMTTAKHKQTDPGMKGYLVTAGERQQAATYQSMISSVFEDSSDEMKNLRVMLEKNPYPDQNASTLKREIMSNPRLAHLKPKVYAIEELTKSYTDKGLLPSGIEYNNGVEAILSGKAPAARKQDISAVKSPSGIPRLAKAPPPKPLETAIKATAIQAGLDPVLFENVVYAESGFNPNASSGKGAVGLTGLMKDAAKEVGVADRYNPDQNLMGGAKYLKKQIDNFGKVRGLIAYNWGPANVMKDKDLKKLPAETITYVNKVLGGTLARGKQTGKLVFEYADKRREDV